MSSLDGNERRYSFMGVSGTGIPAARRRRRRRSGLISGAKSSIGTSSATGSSSSGSRKWVGVAWSCGSARRACLRIWSASSESSWNARKGPAAPDKIGPDDDRHRHLSQRSRCRRFRPTACRRGQRNHTLQGGLRPVARTRRAPCRQALHRARGADQERLRCGRDAMRNQPHPESDRGYPTTVTA
jgi:hypothetical protein